MFMEDIYNIISHPIRRKMLSSIYQTQFLTFSIMKKDWNLSTGNIYHHIKILSNLVTQDEKNRYILTDKGLEVCEWFLGFEGKVKVEKIDAFTQISRPIVENMIKYQNWLFIIGPIIILAGNLAAFKLEVINFGPFILTDHHDHQVGLLIFNLLSIPTLFVSSWAISILVKKGGIGLRYLFLSLITILIPTNLIVLLIYLLSNISVHLWVYILIIVINHLYFLFISSSFMTYQGIGVEKSAIGSLFLLYLIMFAVFAFLS